MVNFKYITVIWLFIGTMIWYSNKQVNNSLQERDNRARAEFKRQLDSIEHIIDMNNTSIDSLILKQDAIRKYYSDKLVALEERRLHELAKVKRIANAKYKTLKEDLDNSTNPDSVVNSLLENLFD